MTLTQPCFNLPRPLAVTAQMTYALINSAQPPIGCGGKKTMPRRDNTDQLYGQHVFVHANWTMKWINFTAAFCHQILLYVTVAHLMDLQSAMDKLLSFDWQTEKTVSVFSSRVRPWLSAL